MTLHELSARLEETGYPVAYDHFQTKTALPFICYRETAAHCLYADGGVYHKACFVEVELYADGDKGRDLTAEGKVEKALSSFAWTRSVVYIDSERCYETIYEIEV